MPSFAPDTSKERRSLVSDRPITNLICLTGGSPSSGSFSIALTYLAISDARLVSSALRHAGDEFEVFERRLVCTWAGE